MLRRALPCSFALAAFVAFATGRAAAQQTPPGAPPAPPPAVTEAPPPYAAPAAAAPAAPSLICDPQCRDGFTCRQGQCVSICNPPCPTGTACVDGRRCEAPAPTAAASPPTYEPPPPPQKSFLEHSHAMMAFHYGFPGGLEADGVEGDSRNTLGFNLRSDTPIAGYVLLGPMLQMGAWAPDVPDVDRNFYFDLDLLLRLRLPITTPSVNYQVWVGMPIGITIDVLGDGLDDVSSVGLGWNIGVLVGGAVHLTPKFGFFAEGGWQQHRITHGGGEVQDLDVVLRQGVMNLGIVVRN